MANPVAFQQAIGTTATSAGALAQLTAIVGPVLKSGVKLNAPSTNSGYIVYAFTSAVTTGTGFILNNGASETVNAGEIGGDLANLWLVASAASQTLSGVVI